MSKRLIPFLLFGIALFLIVPPAFAQRLTGSMTKPASRFRA
jgi:hypothetical protein